MDAAVMEGCIDDIEELTDENSDFRRVLYTGRTSTGFDERSSRAEGSARRSTMMGTSSSGLRRAKGEVVIDGHRSKIMGDDAIIVPACARRNIINTGDKPLRLFTLYGSPAHRDGTVRANNVRGAVPQMGRP